MRKEDLPTAQYLMLETLAARHRLGEPYWTFPRGHARVARALADLGLVSWQSGVEQGTITVRLTDAGQQLCLSPAHTPAAFSGTDLDTLADAIVTALAETYSPTHTANPAYKGYRRTPDVEPDIERTLEERMNDGCMTVFTDADGHRSIRALTYREVAQVAVGVLAAFSEVRRESADEDTSDYLRTMLAGTETPEFAERVRLLAEQQEPWKLPRSQPPGVNS